MPDDLAALLNPPTPSFEHLGPPKWWQCGQCGLNILVYPALPVNHKCEDYNPHCGVHVFRTYYIMDDNGGVYALSLTDVIEDDPLLAVWSFDGEAREVPWKRHKVSGELWFFPPDPEHSIGNCLRYDNRIQKHLEVPRVMRAELALRGRHSA